MEGKLLEAVTEEQVVAWIIIAALVVYFIYKEWPEFKKRISAGAVKTHKDEESDKTVEKRLEGIENRLSTIEEKLNSDYVRLAAVEKESHRNKHMAEESLEEREIIMRALLGALGGLQELGANGPTEKAVNEINTYLNKKAHDKEPEG